MLIAQVNWEISIARAVVIESVYHLQTTAKASAEAAIRRSPSESPRHFRTNGAKVS